MPVSKAQLKATKKYEEKNYYKTLVRFPKDAEGLIRSKASTSVNAYIVDLVLKDIGYRKDDK